MGLTAAFRKKWDRFDLDIAFQIDEGLTVSLGGGKNYHAASYRRSAATR
jgi:hypothetical protein